MSESPLARLRSRINRGDSWLTYDLGRLLSGDGLDEAALEELETRLLTADAGINATQALVDHLRKRLLQGRIRDVAELRTALKAAIVEILRPCQRALEIPADRRPFVVLMVGVNGAGKTTTLGKLASRWRAEGHSVVMAAGDTFRAAATEQLRGWADRTGATLVAQSAGADSASVIHDALQAARARGSGVLLADTAGRLHTQDHLMEELRKIQRVIKRLDPQAPHEVLLVLDANSGSNVLVQARQFHEALGVTGVILTKLDGGARGGTLLALAQDTALPICFLGMGESQEDLVPFDAEIFADALLS